ncbi:hypothetical protein GCM10014715_18820 [Streptomyces spiralis]|uniref:Uncharacterized protein n=1 Tax=Streptomyces spiralis TaxID=66376 RepID=A0A918ZS09_9ACTN|nr:hypothetical protein GCM10014715_18820 [Streptomyces spiralis]
MTREHLGGETEPIIWGVLTVAGLAAVLIGFGIKVATSQP